MSDFSVKDIKRRMEGAIGALKHEFSGLRTGRASASLLENIQVEAYGSSQPITQVASINVPEPRMLSVNVWDKGNVQAVEKAIRNSNLGVNPIVDGTSLRVPIPPLNEERRTELTKVAGGYAEQARVAVRNVRRDGMDMLKRQEKDGDISEDEHKKLAAEVQAATDQSIKEIDEALKHKQEEIMQV